MIPSAILRRLWFERFQCSMPWALCHQEAGTLSLSLRLSPGYYATCRWAAAYLVSVCESLHCSRVEHVPCIPTKERPDILNLEFSRAAEALKPPSPKTDPRCKSTPLNPLPDPRDPHDAQTQRTLPQMKQSLEPGIVNRLIIVAIIPIYYSNDTNTRNPTHSGASRYRFEADIEFPGSRPGITSQASRAACGSPGMHPSVNSTVISYLQL